MKVLVFTTVFPSEAEPLHGLFVEERIRHAARHADVRVVAPVPWWGGARRAPRRELHDGFEVLHPTFWYVPKVLKALDGLLLFLSSLWCVWRLRRRFDFDLIDAHFGYPDGFAAVLLGRVFRRPVTITVRGTEPLIAAAHPLRRRALAFALRRADRVIAVAKSLGEAAASLGARGVQVIANGVDVVRFAPESQEAARSRCGLPLGARVIVSVGHLSKRKGFHRVLAALPEVARAHPGAVFAIVGGAGAEGNIEPELRRLARELGLEDRVVFAGPRPPAEVVTWLNAADVFVLASDHEGCPNVVWEALACGRPVVATRVGEVDRMVPAHAGILVDRADDLPALARALADALGRRWEHALIRAYAERHTWAGVAERVAEVWNEAA